MFPKESSKSQNYSTEGITYICNEIILYLKEQLSDDYNKLAQLWRKNADRAAQSSLNNRLLLTEAFKDPYKMTLAQLVGNAFERQQVITQFLNQLLDRTSIPTYPVKFYDSTVFTTLRLHLYAHPKEYLWKTFISIAFGLIPDFPKLIFHVFHPAPYQDKEKSNIQLIPPARLYLPEKAFFIDPPAMLETQQDRYKYKLGIGHRGLEHTLPGLDRICQEKGIETYVVDQYIIRIWYYTTSGQEHSFEAFKRFIMRWTQPKCDPDKEFMPLYDAVDAVDKELKNEIVSKLTSCLEQEDKSSIIEEIWQYRTRLIDKLQNNDRFREYLHGWYTHGM